MKDKMTDIVNFPAIVRDGEIIVMNTDLLRLNESQRLAMAKLVKGKLVYKKLRAMYTVPEQTFCDHYDCFKLANPGTDDCGGHRA